MDANLVWFSDQDKLMTIRLMKSQTLSGPGRLPLIGINIQYFSFC